MAVEEVELLDDFWVFNVNANPLGDLPRRLKTPASARKIPVHPELIRLGLLDFLKKPRKNRLIFPDAIADTHSVNVVFSDIYSKRLNRIIREVGITDPAVVVHSLRHYCRQATKHAEIPIEAAKQIGGWTTGGDMAEHYGGGFSLKKLNKLMKRVKFKVLAGLEPRGFDK